MKEITIEKHIEKLREYKVANNKDLHWYGQKLREVASYYDEEADEYFEEAQKDGR